MSDDTPPPSTSPSPDGASAATPPSPATPAAATGQPPNPAPAAVPAARPLTPEEQMEAFAQDLKENDWGHQPC